MSVVFEIIIFVMGSIFGLALGDKIQNKLDNDRCADMTNGDRIRVMTDEELARTFRLDICNMIPHENCTLLAPTCDECRMEWLRKEANDG